VADIFFGGGLNEQDEFNVSLDECTAGQNFRLHTTAKQFRPRSPQDLVGTVTTNAGEITGLMQLIKRDDTQTQLIVSDEIVYSWDLASSLTSVGTVVTDSRLRAVPWLLDEVLVITDIDLQNPLAKWDGTSWSRLKQTITGTATVSVNALTQAAGTATMTATAHGYSSDDLVTIVGATPDAYNGEKQITVTGADTATFSIASGTSSPATGTITAFVGPDIRAKYAIEHNGRIWLFNIQVDGTNTPHMILASGFEDAENYDTATRAKAGGITSSAPFFQFINDLRPINGVAQIFDTIVCSTENGRLFRLVGNDALEYDWLEFYPGSAAVGDESFVNVGNDIQYMKVGGEIESMSSTEKFGDITADDLSRWIPTQTADITAALCVYDQDQQLVYYFISGKVLVYDKRIATRTQLSPWSVYKTLMANAFNTKAAAYIRRTDGTWTVMWGDSLGFVYDMNGTGALGDSGDETPIVVTRTLRRVNELNSHNENTFGRVEYKRKGELSLDMAFRWAEEYHDFTSSVLLKGPLVSESPPVYCIGPTCPGGDFYFAGDFYFNAGDIESQRISSAGFQPVGKAPAFTLTMTLTSIINFQINKLTLNE